MQFIPIMTSRNNKQSIGEADLIPAGLAAHILGFKQTTPIMNYVKKGYLTARTSPQNNRKYFDSKDILNFPKPLPIPPPSDKFKGHGRPEKER